MNSPFNRYISYPGLILEWFISVGADTPDKQNPTFSIGEVADRELLATYSTVWCNQIGAVGKRTLFKSIQLMEVQV